MTVLLVDVANVVGARPDGWWRDRTGATERFLRRLTALPGRPMAGPQGSPLVCTAVYAVVEGSARDVAAPSGVRVVRAPASGDDAIVACATELAQHGRPLLVVTADRELRERLPGGTPVAGPRWLREQLDGPDAAA
jgi:hypothetical protein